LRIFLTRPWVRQRGASAQNVVKRVGMLSGPGGLGSDQLDTESVRDSARDLVLQSEQIAGVVVEPLRPKMRVGCGIDQLGADAKLVAGPPDASFEHIAHAQLP